MTQDQPILFGKSPGRTADHPCGSFAGEYRHSRPESCPDFVSKGLLLSPLLRMCCSAAICLGCVLPCLGQSGDNRNTTDQEPTSTKVTKISDNLIEQRPSTLILPSEPVGVDEERQWRSGGTRGFVSTESHRLPEGYVVAGQAGIIVEEDQWLTAHLEQSPNLPKAPPLRLLPNRQLSLIEAILAHADSSPTFVMTGRVTEFQGVNYLLLENVLERPKALPAAQPEPPRVPEPTLNEDSSENQTVREPTPEEIISELMKKKPLRSVVLPREPTASAKQPQPGATDQGNTGLAAESARLPEHTMLIDRSGRIIPAESGYMFSFEDQGLNPTDHPLRLLPNRMLETAIALSAGGAKSMVFIVSGEVTAHRGTNYLLIRKLLVRRNMGNFN